MLLRKITEEPIGIGRRGRCDVARPQLFGTYVAPRAGAATSATSERLHALVGAAKEFLTTAMQVALSAPAEDQPAIIMFAEPFSIGCTPCSTTLLRPRCFAA